MDNKIDTIDTAYACEEQRGMFGWSSILSALQSYMNTPDGIEKFGDFLESKRNVAFVDTRVDCFPYHADYNSSWRSVFNWIAQTDLVINVPEEKNRDKMASCIARACLNFTDKNSQTLEQLVQNEFPDRVSQFLVGDEYLQDEIEAMIAHLLLFAREHIRNY